MGKDRCSSHGMEANMTRVCIGIGSNLGDRLAHVDAALAALASLRETRLLAVSDIIETAPVGPVEQGAFLNAAAVLDTELSPRQLLAELVNIEQSRGRPVEGQRVKWGPRPLDLDILLYGSQIVDEPATPSQPGLQIPHPQMHLRDFVLRPLAQIIPEMRHPVLGLTINELFTQRKPSPSGAGSPPTTHAST